MQKRILIALVLVLAIVGCHSESATNPTPSAQQTKVVCVDSYPLASVARRLLGDSIKVVMPAPAGTNPADWVPTVEDVNTFQHADVILLNGAGLSSWLDTVSLADSKSVDTSAEFKDSLIMSEQVLTHSHGPGGEHSHGSIACTTWLDLDLFAKQIDVIADSLKRTYPNLKSEISDRHQKLKDELRDLDSQLQVVSKVLAGKPMIASHPVYQYLAQRYGLTISAVHWEPEVTPTAEQIEELKKLQASTGATVMIWEGEPANAVREPVDALGLKSVVLDPGGAQPVELEKNTDWFQLMACNIQTCKELAAEFESAK